MEVASGQVRVQVRTPRPGVILVVDDEAAGRELLKGLLVSQGYEVITAGGGQEALGVLNQAEIDLALLDMMMPRMDGVELCKHIRRQADYDLLPIIFTTSLHDRASRIRAKEAGADDLLVKPIDGLELFVRVESLLRTRAHTKLALREHSRLVSELARTRAVIFGEPRMDGAPSPEPGAQNVVRRCRQILDAALHDAWAQTDSAQDRLKALDALLRTLEKQLSALADPRHPDRE